MYSSVERGTNRASFRRSPYVPTTDSYNAQKDRSAKRGEHSPRQRQLVARLPPHDVHVDRRRLETGVTEHPLHEARVTGLHRQPHPEPVA